MTSVSGILRISSDQSDSNDAVLSELLLKVNGIPERLEQLENNIGVRFSQMLTAFGDSVKMGTAHTTQEDIQNEILKSFFSTLMTNPNEGINQMQNLMQAQKFMQDNGLIKK